MQKLSLRKTIIYLSLLAFSAGLKGAPSPIFQVGTEVFSSSFDGPDGAPKSSVTRWQLGFTLPFTLEKLSLPQTGSIEISLSSPFGGLRSLRAYETNDLYTLRYGNFENQFQAKAGATLQLIQETLLIESGVRFSLSGAGNQEATLSTVNPTGRLALDVGLNSALYSGIHFKQEKFRLSLGYEQELAPEFIQKFDAKAPVGGENTFHQPLEARSTLYFEPHVFLIEGTYDFNSFSATLALSYELWEHYRHPIVYTEVLDAQGKKVASRLPETPIRNTLNPSVTVDIPLSENWENFLGFKYQPTAVLDLSGLGNPLDSNAYIVATGLSYQEEAFRFSLSLERHFFETRDVVKKADSSSYTFGGGAFHLGGQLGLTL